MKEVKQRASESEKGCSQKRTHW